MLDLVYSGLVCHYRIASVHVVRDFVIHQAGREALRVARLPREQLLLSERDGDLELGLFVDPRALENLAANDPRRRLDATNLGDFLLTVEGVSHFVYVAWRAR